MENVKIGFLPFYLKLYDDKAARLRPGIEAYCSSIVEELKKTGVELAVADICRIKPEFEAAVSYFEKENVDAIVTVHLAYSPSLESAEVMAKTELPVLVLDTTRDYSYSFYSEPGLVSYNHGIHGVQDFCNLLKRHGKDYSLFVGHYTETDVLSRVADAARAIKAAKSLSGMKVGQIGGSFESMGDFIAPKSAMDRLGVTIIECDGEELSALQSTVTDEEIKAEYEIDKSVEGIDNIDYEQYAYTERVALGVRKWIEKNQLSAFTMTFLSAGKVGGFDTMPFSESSKAMARGIGYAGEGDTLTAALVGALSKTFDKVNFTELFCPDWKDGNIYMSHMGESNLKLLKGKHMEIKPFPYADGPNPTCILGNMIAGKACVFNLLPNAEGWFDVIIAEGEMLDTPDRLESYITSMNGWFKPQLELNTFLEKYSELGGTHHSALVYGVSASSLAQFAKTLGMKYTIL